MMLTTPTPRATTKRMSSDRFTKFCATPAASGVLHQQQSSAAAWQRRGDACGRPAAGSQTVQCQLTAEDGETNGSRIPLSNTNHIVEQLNYQQSPTPMHHISMQPGYSRLRRPGDSERRH